MREDISRKPAIGIRWHDEEFQLHDQKFEGMLARIIQHEYDHIEGILMVDRINSLKRVLLNRRLNDISKGNVDTSYKMIFPQLKNERNSTSHESKDIVNVTDAPGPLFMRSFKE